MFYSLFFVIAQIHALAKLHCQLQIPAFTIPCFTDSGFYNSVFYRFRVLQLRVLQIPAFTIPCLTDSGFYNSVFYRFRLLQFRVFISLIPFLIPFLDSSFRILQIAVILWHKLDTHAKTYLSAAFAQEGNRISIKRKQYSIVFLVHFSLL